MKNLFYIFGAVCAVLVPTTIASAKSTRLQTVNITDRHLSLEGGEARLYRINDPRRSYCRIEVTHLGEMGKWIYVFDFGPMLFAAERREYSYNGYFTDPDRKETLTKRTSLSTSQGRESLPKEFAEYKSFFDARRLANCSAK